MWTPRSILRAGKMDVMMSPLDADHRFDRRYGTGSGVKLYIFSVEQVKMVHFKVSGK